MTPSGSSVLSVRQDYLERMVKTMLEPLQNEIGGLEDLDAHTLTVFLLGLIVHLKTQGSIYYTELDSFIEKSGEPFIINRIPWMPNFSRNARVPSFLTTKKAYRFDPLFSKGRRSSWCESWADKCFSPLHPLIKDLIGAIYDRVLKSLVEQDILVEKKTGPNQIKSDRVWGLMPEALGVYHHVIGFSCGVCSHQVSVPIQESDWWQDAPCLRFHCAGAYRKTGGGDNYYKTLYASGDMKRIFAAEHTGLLKRDDREQLEKEFKSKDRKPWYPNLLSCTPTLELGIDIGELSSVILCSVPPAQANYLQRIGRAGRQDGNALNFTVANARPHDLYFFAEPETMLSGRVDPPGIFLNASAVLERQFTAFCFDRWVETGISDHAIPVKLRHVLGNLEPMDVKKFPHNLRQFVETRQTLLFDGFIDMFSDTLTDDSIQYLKQFIEGDQEGSLSWRIADKLLAHFKERESLKRKISTLTGKIRKKKEQKAKDKNYEQELDELIREKSGLQSLVTRINDRHTLNFFTDEGLIPNYAFPEAGVMLRSIIYRRKANAGDGESKYHNNLFDYERPAVGAITELAPSAAFYAGGRKVRVDQVDLSVSEVEIWRLCNNCPYMAVEGSVADYAACPQCGSTLWPDAGRKRRMLKMRQMFATASDRESRINDDSDDRDVSFFSRQIFVGYQEADVTDAYKIVDDELPFGFQFLSKAIFREVNFGEKGDAGEKITVAGNELPGKGFMICKYCGKVQNHKGAIKHALTCPARKKDAETNLADCVYLYRQFSSEAILMLLPVTTFEGSEQKLHSFIAALHLGLQQMFGGKIDHLQTALHEEPVPDSTHRKKYLALYDTVPGGTGYLKQLMRSPKPLMTLFEKALHVLCNCSCHQDPDKDGCYRCLFAYRRSYNMAGTSRDAAISMLSDILARKTQLTQTNTLRNIRINALFDSELEARFIEALRQVRTRDLPVTLKKEVVNGKPGYFFKIKEQSWYIELQVHLGQADGVGFPSKADFMFRPARKQNGIKPIVVFTDGFSFHKNRIGKDMAQRAAIVQSGKYHVISLSWKDVENQYRNLGGYYENHTAFQDVQKNAIYNKLTDFYKIEGTQAINTADSFQWLVQLLKAPDFNTWGRHAFIHASMHLDHKRFASTKGLKEWKEEFAAAMSPDVTEFVQEQIKHSDDTWYYGLSVRNTMRIFAAISKNALQTGHVPGMYLSCCIEDIPKNRDAPEFEAVWNGYLRFYNLMQFLPHACFATRQGIMDGHTFQFASETDPGGTQQDHPEWEEVYELTHEKNHELIRKLAKTGCPAPEIGYELINADGAIIAEAEFAWPDMKIAFLEADQASDAEIFKQSGWQAIMIDDAIADFKTCADLF